MGIKPEQLKTVKLPETAGYNGIVIPDGWRLEYDKGLGTPAPTPYLIDPKDGGYAPEVINIDKGRQMFVDGFLIGKTDLSTVYHKAVIRDQPVFKSEKPWERGNSAVPVSGGLWFDKDEKIFKLWYSAGFCNRLAYATSRDGVHWERPALTYDGTNQLMRDMSQVCSTSIIIDYNAEPKERYKMMLRLRDMAVETDHAATLYVSADGLNWESVGRTGYLGDRSTCYYDELNDKWVFSIRNSTPNVAWGDLVYQSKWIRTRAYSANKDFRQAAKWDIDDPEKAPAFWLKTDSLDEIDHSQYGERPPQLYNVDAISYESITLGFFQIWYGPEVNDLQITKRPKITELQAMYSRDGFHFYRPERGVDNAFIPAARVDGRWDRGYVQSVTGGVIVYDDEIRIYYAGFSGLTEKKGEWVYDGHAGGSMGLASLRRDGFASLDGSGEVITKTLTVTKDVKYLFVNAKAENGSLRAEILDTDGNVVEGYSLDNCIPMCEDSCRTRLTWKGADDLSFLQNKGFCLRFVQENTEFYSFWLSADKNGTSDGAMAAGYVEGTPAEF